MGAMPTTWRTELVDERLRALGWRCHAQDGRRIDLCKRCYDTRLLDAHERASAAQGRPKALGSHNTQPAAPEPTTGRQGVQDDHALQDALDAMRRGASGHRCARCLAPVEPMDPAWRWSGQGWQHLCHDLQTTCPQAGPSPAQFAFENCPACGAGDDGCRFNSSKQACMCGWRRVE